MPQPTQQLTAPVSAIADPSGAATFSFASPAIGTTWTGTISVPGSPPTAQHTVVVGSTPWGAWGGVSLFGPIQCVPNQQVVINSVGMIPGTSYEAVFLSMSSDTSLTPPTYPQPNSSVASQVTGQVFLGTGRVLSGGSPVIVTLTPQTTWRSVWVVAQGNTVPLVTGLQSGIAYSPFTPPYFQSNGFMYRFAIVEGVDQTISVTLPVAGSSYTFWYGADLADIDIAVYPDFGSAFTVGNGSAPGTGNTLPLDVVEYGGLIHLTSGPILNGATWAALAAAAAGKAYRLHRYAQFDNTIGLPPTGASFITTAVTTVPIGGIPSGQYVDNLDGLITAEKVDVANVTGATAKFTLSYDNITLPTIS